LVRSLQDRSLHALFINHRKDEDEGVRGSSGSHLGGIAECRPGRLQVITATEAEVEELKQKSEREDRAVEVCRSKTAELGLPMTITRAEFQFHGKKLTFYYTAVSDVDFWDLVRTLFKVFGTRIWMAWCDGGQA
jgi:cell fate regulator YaaT (PSP1 superfamily)